MGRKGADVAEATIANSLRAARGRRGWTREALAYHSGVSWSAIAQIETGRRRDVRLASLSALAEALGVTVDYLVGGAATVRPRLLDHRALIYRSHEEFVAATGPFVAEGIARAECLLVVTTKALIARLRDELGGDARQVKFADASRWYRSPIGALVAYRRFVEEKFEAGAPWIRIVGEPRWAGLTPGEVEAWTRYESMLNLSFASSPVTIMCPYDARGTAGRVIAGAQSTHPELMQAGDIVPSPAYQEPEEFLLAPAGGRRGRFARVD